MKRVAPVLLSAVMLAGCASSSSDEAQVPPPTVLPASIPAQMQTPVPPAATPEITPSATQIPAPTVTLEEWAAAMPTQKPTYTLSEGAAQLQEYVAWPDQPVTLEIPSWNGTMEEAAQAYGVPLEALQSMNPNPETSNQTSDGTTIYYNLKLQDDYLVPRPLMKYVTISTPWVEYSIERTDNYMVPAALSDQAAACMATAYDFQYEHYGMQGGIWPAAYDEATGRYYTEEGGLYTTYSDLTRYLEAVYTPAVCEKILGGPISQEDPQNWHPYYQGENDTICFYGGNRGSNIQYCGKSFTEPEVQPDGSIRFWQLALTVESDDFNGWGEEITYTPDTANATIVRLEPTETGWRVAELSLPN